MLKANLSSDEFKALPIPLKEHYVLSDGAFLLQAEGMVPATALADARAKVAEFRDNNILLRQQAETFEGFDPKEVKALRDQATVDQALISGLSAAGISGSLLPDALARGRQIFRVVDGAVVAMAGDKPIFRTDDPCEKLSISAWTKTLPTAFFYAKR